MCHSEQIDNDVHNAGMTLEIKMLYVHLIPKDANKTAVLPKPSGHESKM